MKYVTPVLVAFVVVVALWVVALCGGSWFFFGGNVMKLLEPVNETVVGDPRRRDAGPVIELDGGDY